MISAMNEAAIRAIARDETMKALREMLGTSPPAEPQTVRSIPAAAHACGYGVSAFKGIMRELTEGVHYWQYNSSNARVPHYEFDVDAIKKYLKERGK